MAQVAVTISGRVYRMACDEGEEEHLLELARRLDGKIGELRTQFGEIGDQRITVMAALTIADDLSSAERRIAELEGEVAAASDRRREADDRIDALSEAVAAAIDDVAARIDDVTQDLSPDRGARG